MYMKIYYINIIYCEPITHLIRLTYYITISLLVLYITISLLLMGPHFCYRAHCRRPTKATNYNINIGIKRHFTNNQNILSSFLFLSGEHTNETKLCHN